MRQRPAPLLFALPRGSSKRISHFDERFQLLFRIGKQILIERDGSGGEEYQGGRSPESEGATIIEFGHLLSDLASTVLAAFTIRRSGVATAGKDDRSNHCSGDGYE